MPKNLNYPLASFQKSYALADAVNALGGSCTVENAAQKMQRKVSGGFMVIISSAQKFKLTNFEKGLITTTEEYKLIKHSYTNSERLDLLRKAFLSPQIFSLLYERFKGKELPTEMLDKILIREFGVEESTAGRIAGYFVDGLKTYGLLNGSTVLSLEHEQSEDPIIQNIFETEKTENKAVEEQFVQQKTEALNKDASFTGLNLVGFEFEIAGPGINTKVTIDDEEDLLIVEAMLKKIRKALNGKDK
ncbi:MAG: hypothetical protein V5804_05290 [Mucilaginibacter sp.]|uniref:hypothetical protein n=1 Tax=Mucilaginibacter sp. TaxID=1882438 RepID=UPI0034E505BD